MLAEAKIGFRDSRDLRRTARDVVLRANLFTYCLGLLIPRRRRESLWLWYAYFRLLDDQVDETPGDLAAKLAPLDAQRQAVDLLYDNARPPPDASLPFLVELIQRDRSNGSPLRPWITGMLDAIRADISRKGKPGPYLALISQFRLEVESYLGVLSVLAGQKVIGRPLGSSAALGAKIIHVLRDLRKDVDQQVLNISTEEIEFLAAGSEALWDSGSTVHADWVAERLSTAAMLLEGGLREIRGAKLRYRIIVAILITKYQLYLDAIRRDGCVLAGRPVPSWRATFRVAPVNLAAAWLGRRCPTRRRAVQPIFPAKTPNGLVRSLHLHPFANLGAVRVLDRHTQPDSMNPDRLSRLRRRFSVAYCLGKEAHRWLSPHSPREAHRAAGLVYAFWAITILELDRAIDEGRVPKNAVEDWAKGWLRSLCEPEAYSGSGPPSSIPAVLSNVATFGSAFRSAVAVFFAEGFTGRWQPALGDFLGEAENFLAAQLASAAQAEPSGAKDWCWYSRRLLHQKTVPFFRAPLCLFADGADRLVQLDRDLRILNGYYCHWQMLDDLADMTEDTAEGIVTTPGFLLISQGRVAEMCISGGNGVGAPPLLLADPVITSMLVHPPFSGLLFDPERALATARAGASGADGGRNLWLLRCALENRQADEWLSLTELMNERRAQSRSYLDAMSGGRHATALRMIESSGVAERVLAVCSSPHRAAIVRNRLRGSAKRTLEILDALMFNSLAKARRRCRDEW